MSANHNFFAQWYLLKTDTALDEFIISKDEVEKIKWISKNYLEIDLEKHPDKYTSGMPELFRRLKKYI